MAKNNTLWWAVLALWSGGATWFHVCQIKQLCADPAPVVNEVALESADPLLIRDGRYLDLTSSGNFSFAKSGYEPNWSGVSVEVDSLAAYLTANPNRQLVINGYYASTEKNTSKFENLGLARAAAIKDYLVSKGLPPERFSTQGILLDELIFTRDSLRGGIGFGFSGKSVSAGDLAKEQKFESVFTTMDLYFNTGKSDYIRTTDNQKFVSEAKKFLSENPDKKLKLTGHTDDVGDDAANLKLSENRAEDVKKQLVKLGINASQLVTEAKGEVEPKESNATEGGRSANRRVAIIVE